MRSSARRDRCAPMSATANSSSAMKSRSPTASMLFGESDVKPRLPWSSTREMGYADPATAPEPSGRTAADGQRCASRARSRSSGQKCDSIQCAADTGCARCRCVYDGIMSSSSADGLIDHHLLQIAHGDVELIARVDRPEPRRGRDLIVAAAPGMKLRRDVADLLVQQPVDHRVNVFVGRLGQGTVREVSRRHASSPLSICLLSSRVSTPASQSATAHAFDSRMSCGQRRKSVPMERLSASSAAAVGTENRPPHSLCDLCFGHVSPASVPASTGASSAGVTGATAFAASS